MRCAINDWDSGYGKLKLQAKQKDVKEAQQKSFEQLKQLYKKATTDKCSCCSYKWVFNFP